MESEHPITVKKCPFCAEQIQAEAVKCRFCGEFLDRPAVRSAAPAPGRFTKGFLVAVFVALGLVLLVSILPIGPGKGGGKESTGSGRLMAVTKDCYCGYSAADAAIASIAIERGDSSTIRGLIVNSRVEALQPGDSVRLLSQDSEWVMVAVLSGWKVGKRCWIAMDLLR